MRQDREHPLYYLDAETRKVAPSELTLVATYIWVDDELKALQAQGLKLPPKQKHQKATLAELLTLAVSKIRPSAVTLFLQGQDLAKGYLAAKTTLKPYFPSLPHLSRFYRVLQKAQGLLAHLAIRLSGGQGLLQVVDLKPIPLAHGHRIHGLGLPEAAVGVGPLGAFAGYVLMPVMNERGLFWNLSVHALNYLHACPPSHPPDPCAGGPAPGAGDQPRGPPQGPAPGPSARKGYLAAILLAAQGWTAPRIARRLGLDRTTLHRDLRRWLERGIEGLEDGKPPGARPRWTPAMSAFLRELLRGRRPGLPPGFWRLWRGASS